MPRPPITIERLREIVEEADGLRGRPLALVNEDGKYMLKPASDVASNPDAIAVTTPKIKDEKWAHLMGVSLQPPPELDPTDRDMSKSFDAFFWSESAVDKFLIPYYVRMKKTNFLDDLRKAIASKNVYLIAHYPRTVLLDVEPAASVRILAAESPDLIDRPKFLTLEQWKGTQGLF